MKRSEIYSWRVAGELKSALEHEARREGESVGRLLERIAREWLNSKRTANGEEEDEQKRLHAAVSKYVGSIGGKNPDRSTEVRTLVKRRLQARHGR